MRCGRNRRVVGNDEQAVQPEVRAILERRTLGADEAKSLATVDPLEVSLAKICGSLTSGLSNIAATLEAPLSRIAYVLQTLGERAA